MVVTIAVAYTFVFSNPLFLANFNSALAGGAPPLKATPYLPSGSVFHWSTSGFAYSCGNGGPGILEVVNGGSAAVTVVSVSIAYNGQVYNATGPSCSVGPGNTVISITSLAAPPGLQGSAFTGYLAAPGGKLYSFSGTWQ